MYQEIAVAKGTEYDRLNQRMDKCQDNIEKLSDDIQRLQGMQWYKRRTCISWYKPVFFSITKKSLTVSFHILSMSGWRRA